jgi:hypothetical protein
MKRLAQRIAMVGLVVAGGLCAAGLASAQLADVFLKSGLKLRGDVTTVDNTVVIKNAAGELRLPREDVERIEPVEEPVGRATTTPAVPASQPAGSEPATQPAAPPELPPAPPLSDEDIQRLKLAELRLDGPPENVRVRFLRKGKQRDLAAEVLDELRQRPDYRPEWEETLLHGQPSQKLRLIVRTTDAEHVDRIVIENDPEVFATFRRRVLPLVERGCARSGCHGGRSARVFRFPSGSPTSDTYAYTSFVLLDQMETADGPVLDRDDPEASRLLDYMLPPKADEKAHPAVSHGPPFQAVLRDRGDRLYTTVLDWISALRMPHPTYGLAYKNPYAGQVTDQGVGEPAPASEPLSGPP